MTTRIFDKSNDSPIIGFRIIVEVAYEMDEKLTWHDPLAFQLADVSRRSTKNADTAMRMLASFSKGLIIHHLHTQYFELAQAVWLVWGGMGRHHK